MIEDVIVVDGVVHAYDFRPAMSGAIPGRTHQLGHVGLSSRLREHEDYILTVDEFEREFTPEELVSCVFRESQVDFAAYHHLNGVGTRRPLGSTQSSPIEAGVAARDIAPGRVFLYPSPIAPWNVSRTIDEIDQWVDEMGIVGVKFFPHEYDPATGAGHDVMFDDKEMIFPILDHARSRGIKVIGIHKAMGSRVRAFGLSDLDDTVAAFPDLNFEIVHAGMAFVEDTLRVGLRKNVFLNLESTSGLLSVAPRRFAEVLGQFLVPISEHPNAVDRVIWASGATIRHPQPLLELFWDFEMPEDLMRDYGYPEVTREMKRKMLGENWARMHGVDLRELMAALPDDELARQKASGELVRPWAAVRAAEQAA